MWRILFRGFALLMMVLALTGFSGKAPPPERVSAEHHFSNPQFDADISAAIQLVMLGCAGKLQLALTSAGDYAPADMPKLHECLLTETRRITRPAVQSLLNRQLPRSELGAFVLKRAAEFAVANNHRVSALGLEALIHWAREKGKQ